MLTEQFRDIFESIKTSEKLLSPADWAEKYRTLTSDVSTQQGKFKYAGTPYLREIVNTLSPYHPARIVGVMKAAQIGYTEGVIVNGILWMIANDPGNCLSLSANDELSKEMIESRLDQGIQSCGIQHLIRPNTIRKRNSRTGDTSKSKEYSGGRLFAGGLKSIDKLGKQRSIKYGFFDDFDAADISDKEQGNIFELLQQRFATAARTGKQYYISTPQTRPSNIESIYEMGDQRKWRLPCPKCGAYIEILWQEKKENEDVGIVFKTDDAGRLIEDSVGYVCQECGGFFKEKHKYEMNLSGEWHPTATPARPGIYSYHISAFVSAPWMYSWKDYVYKWLDIYKQGNESVSKKKVFINLVQGLPYEEKQEQIKEGRLINNIRDYEIGTIPTQLSRDDGNGEIILLTFACDLNGTVDDARLDYDVWAHSESGSIYSVDSGSIGTYYTHNRKNDNRTKWTYKNNEPDNVWDILTTQVLEKEYPTQDDRNMKIFIAGVDTGYYTHYAYSFIDNYEGGMVYALKGDISDKFTKYNSNYPLYKPGRERNNLYILTTDMLKDDLSEMINLNWKEGDPQPDNFMNFPQPGGGKYSNKYYFSQYEAEHKVIETNDDGDPVGWKWEKKTSSAQNHFFDVAVYNLGLRTIYAQVFCSMKEFGVKNATWADFSKIMCEKILKIR